jgi:periplasmic divalent cation tolerance protein
MATLDYKRWRLQQQQRNGKVVYNPCSEKPRMKRETKFRVVLVTCSTLEEARKIARGVVEKRAAACVNIVTHAVESFYSWEGKLENTSEYLLIIKTSEEQLQQLQKEVLALHSYDTPEFIVLPIVTGSDAYLKWLGESVDPN